VRRLQRDDGVSFVILLPATPTQGLIALLAVDGELLLGMRSAIVRHCRRGNRVSTHLIFQLFRPGNLDVFVRVDFSFTMFASVQGGAETTPAEKFGAFGAHSGVRNVVGTNHALQSIHRERQNLRERQNACERQYAGDKTLFRYDETVRGQGQFRGREIRWTRVIAAKFITGIDLF